MLEKIIKGVEMAIQNSVLLQQEIHRLQASNKHQEEEKKKNIRASIQDRGSLTGDEGLQRSKEVKTRQEPSTRLWCPAKCSNCNQEGHNRLKYPIRE